MKTRVLSLAAMLTLAGCGDRLADLGGDDENRRPACTPITGWGYFAAGGKHVIFNEDTGSSGTACMCLTEDEILSGSRHDELNDLAYEECTRLVDVYSGNFDWDDCEESYLAGKWPLSVSFAAGDHAWMNIEGLDCSDDGDDAADCSVSGEPGPAPARWFALITLVGLGLRRGYSARKRARAIE